MFFLNSFGINVVMFTNQVVQWDQVLHQHLGFQPVLALQPLLVFQAVLVVLFDQEIHSVLEFLVFLFDLGLLVGLEVYIVKVRMRTKFFFYANFLVQCVQSVFLFSFSLKIKLFSRH